MLPAIVMDYTITDWLYGLSNAIVIFGILSSIYKSNPIYDYIEGMGMGAATAGTVWSSITSVNTQILRPLQTNFTANWWVLIAAVFGFLFFTLFVRQLIEVFRFVSTIALATGLALTIRTAAATMWSEVTSSSHIYDFSYAVLWLFFCFGVLYFIYGKKLDKPMRIPREIGRWAMIFELGTLLTPMYLRYVETSIGWTIKVLDSPAWFIPFIFGAAVLIDIMNNKYKFLTRSKEAVAQT